MLKRKRSWEKIAKTASVVSVILTIAALSASVCNYLFGNNNPNTIQLTPENTIQAERFLYTTSPVIYKNDKIIVTKEHIVLNKDDSIQVGDVINIYITDYGKYIKGSDVNIITNAIKHVKYKELETYNFFNLLKVDEMYKTDGYSPSFAGEPTPNKDGKYVVDGGVVVTKEPIETKEQPLKKELTYKVRNKGYMAETTGIVIVATLSAFITLVLMSVAQHADKKLGGK